ncbi:CBN-DNC-4 protein [Caenorhabditis brenneri]|uniref:Dynactin subunit 4 n=1 Tax=Caenorhabditis brenneri TaxID=135651 RepID=G0P211_CAEBE|nr:CBN-DNC-4 protein [Caenorhabditis brenneri]
MGTLLQYNLIKYECSCGKWRMLPDLFYCRHCFKIKCDDCSCKEVDAIFCPRCLEPSSAPEARMKKHRCMNCNDCAKCGNVLSARTENEKCYLVCQHCRWSSRDAKQEDRENIKSWPSKENPLTSQLNEVTAYMKRLEVMENAPKDLKKGKSSKTWSAIHLKDKFNVQQMVEKRRKALVPDVNPVEAHAPTDPPTLEDELNDRSDVLRTLDQIIMQPLTNSSEPLLPVKVSLIGRVLVRCDECERTLVKRDFGVVTYKFKISSFAREFVPDIRMSRPVEDLKAGVTTPVFLSVTNLSSSSLDITIIPQAEEGFIQCSSEPIKLILPSSRSADSAAPGVHAEQSEVIVFRQHNRIGLRLDVIPSEANLESPVLDLLINYKQDGSFSLLATSEKVLNPEESGVDRILTARLRINLR